MGVRAHTLVGGRSVREDADKLKGGAQVVCGTPGRVLDMITRGILKIRDLKTLVLDEADVVLSMGFVDQIYDIFRTLPQDIQVILVSATMTKDTLEVSRKMLRDPARILIEEKQLNLTGIQQFYVDVQAEDNKYGVLNDLYEFLSVSQSVVFVANRRRAETLAERFRQDDYSVAVIHSDMVRECV
jgi:translation initiation factor 4A